MALNHTDNCSPDSYDDEPPSTSQHSLMTSSPHELACTDPDAQDESLTWLPYSDDPPVQSQGPHIPQHEDNRQGIPTSVLGDYHDTSIHGEQTHTQLVLRQKTMPQRTYDVSGTGHPDVATTINTVSPQYQLSQQVQQLSIDPQCSSSGTATPVPSPRTPEDLYADGMPGHQRSQHSAYGAFICSGGGQSVDIHDISNPRHGSPQTMAENFLYVSPQMESYPLVPQPFGSREEGSTAMDEFYSILELSDHPQHPVPLPGPKRPCPSDFDLPAIDMDELEYWGFSGIQRTSWGTAYAPMPTFRCADLLSIHNRHAPSSDPPIKKKGLDNGLKRAPRVVGKPGMPHPAPPRKWPGQRLTPEEDKMLIELKGEKKLTWSQIKDFFPGRPSNTLKVRHGKLKRRSANTDQPEGATQPLNNSSWCG
ncbi:hypothetical protein Forpe1208_v016204 [Fusarium oxysporum f. sp. rapae]|uniref:Myb-like domain-containing protein n=1 Tax=Fusarium oxysporum f. sp. rapae TaxID=485398 RepID=A0A8J5TXX4_FUSOX|nr:hypothetical protein Forpe1208_v016204 [Fusarium oxysporum f. sp. rapae]